MRFSQTGGGLGLDATPTPLRLIPTRSLTDRTLKRIWTSASLAAASFYRYEGASSVRIDWYRVASGWFQRLFL